MLNIKSITIDKEILGGTPVFTGTRVPVQSLFDWLETETLEEFLENFPSVKKDQAIEVLSNINQLIISENHILDENIA
ncbi:MAG: DUF433 domain-containing protein [Bacteroidetes bacterium]|nr:DUF433 domain-containing protein [Bacteroidota bacterium]MBL7104814.1 DUF433 domain-containing protein [Bacteroidales bacterium]